MLVVVFFCVTLRANIRDMSNILFDLLFFSKFMKLEKKQKDSTLRVSFVLATRLINDLGKDFLIF